MEKKKAHNSNVYIQKANVQQQNRRARNPYF